MNVGNSAVPALPTIVVDRLTRTLFGPAGEQVELPVLSLRLLETLAASSPAFIGAEALLQQVWPDTHIGADALKQRVRLLRVALAAAGYEPRLLDSVRGEGYALRATLRDPTVSQPVQADTPPSGKQPSGKQPSRRWVMLGVGVSVIVLLLAVTPRSRPSGAVVAPIGPSPVRIGIAMPEGSPVSRWLLDALSGNAHVLVVPAVAATNAGDVPACGLASQVHLCLRATPVDGDTTHLTLTLLQVTTGAILLRAEARPADGAGALSSFVLQLAQFASPGVLRWIGGQTGAGDHAFTQFREGARLLASCDVAARGDVIAGLRDAANRSPNFLPGRAMLAIHEMEDAVSRADTFYIAQVMRRADTLVALSADLALAHVAIARGAAMLGVDSLARTAAARATRVQPLLARFFDESRCRTERAQ